jgi:hypothetical protein
MTEVKALLVAFENIKAPVEITRFLVPRLVLRVFRGLGRGRSADFLATLRLQFVNPLLKLLNLLFQPLDLGLFSRNRSGKRKDTGRGNQCRGKFIRIHAIPQFIPANHTAPSRGAHGTGTAQPSEI